MRAKLELLYNLNNCEEVQYINDVLNVSKFKSVMWDIDQYLRGIVKHGISENEIFRDLTQDYDGNEISYTDQQKEDITKGYIEACEHIRSKLWELINEENISLE